VRWAIVGRYVCVPLAYRKLRATAYLLQVGLLECLSQADNRLIKPPKPVNRRQSLSDDGQGRSLSFPRFPGHLLKVRL
jgi:hypothetical protein